MKRVVLSLVLSLVFSGAFAAGQFGTAQYPIRMEDGDEVTNFALSAELNAALGKLTGQVPVGNLNGDVTVYQFYDLNCPYCREAAADVDDLIKADKKLKLVFVPYAVLSVQSVQGALIEIGASKVATPEQFFDFHRRIYMARGTIDGPKTLQAAKEAGLDANKVAALGNTQDGLDTLRANADFGSKAKLMATPAYVINGVAILGHPGLKTLQKIVAAVRACGKVVCV
ncbi:MAG: thioredoxin domain-containing protein [Pseudolabrys sp.]|nr:thioredoxin domain-containing protein [Pseudolabrys sp.]